MSFANCRQNQPKQRTIRRCICGWEGADVRDVKIRVEGKATMYRDETVPMCRLCRAAVRGRWMYADRSTAARARSNDERRRRRLRAGKLKC